MHPLERIGTQIYITPWHSVAEAQARRGLWGQRDYVEVVFTEPLTPEEMEAFTALGGQPYVSSSAYFQEAAWDTTKAKHRINAAEPVGVSYVDHYGSNPSLGLSLALSGFCLCALEEARFDWRGVFALLQGALTQLNRQPASIRLYASAGFHASVDFAQKGLNGILRPREETTTCKGFSTPVCETVTVFEQSCTTLAEDRPENVLLYELHFWEQWRGTPGEMLEGAKTFTERASAFFLDAFADLPGREEVRGAMEAGTLLPFPPVS